MCLRIHFVLIIISYLCITTCNSKIGSEENVSHRSSTPGHRDCYFKMPLMDSGFMPIPFKGNYSEKTEYIYEHHRDLNIHSFDPRVIRPDKNGYLLFKHNSSYKMGCSEENEFMSPTPYPVSEVTVKCIDGYFEYAGKMYEFDEFRCDEIPRAKLYGTEIMCNIKEFGEIKKIGFQSRDTFLNLYRMCFDNEYNITYYAWYFLNSPVYEHYQTSNVKPNFIKNRETCDIDIDAAYENLTKIMEKNLKTEDLLDAYKVKNKKKRSIIPAKLIAENEFVYVAEQNATYFFENTAPQWRQFNNEVWKDFEKSFRRNLAKISGRHLIVAGTYFASSRLELSKSRKHFVRYSPSIKTVPEYFWKMDYNMDTETGIVYIGANNPYKRVNDGGVHICETMPCPGRGFSNLDKRTALFYCCSKESFEKTYGIIDPNVYKEFYYF